MKIELNENIKNKIDAVKLAKNDKTLRSGEQPVYPIVFVSRLIAYYQSK